MWEAVIILSWWGLFAGTHLILSSASVRPNLVEKLGDRAFLGMYSLIALLTFLPLVNSYAHNKHGGEQLWTTLGPFPLAKGGNLVLMALAFVLLVYGLVSRPPSAMMVSGPPEARGLTRITRHPTFAAFFLFGIAHCLMNGYLTDIAFFGGFAVFSWVGAEHQDSRKVVDIPGYAAFKQATSFVPFGAILRGQQRLHFDELRWPIVLLALVICYLVRMYHAQIFGG